MTELETDARFEFVGGMLDNLRMEFGNDCGNDIFQIRHQFQSTLSVFAAAENRPFISEG